MLLLTLTLLGAAHALLVPAPPGPYSVAVKHIELVDPSRIDPFAPEPNTKRRIMASAYLPVDARYGCETMGVPKGTVEKFEMEFCDISTVKRDKKGKKKEFPVAIFSPGFAGTRLVYGGHARSMASLGYIIITIDHTYEAMAVEFPDGSVAYAQPSAASNQSLTLRELDVRSGDESFVISQLSNKTVTDSLFANFPGTFNPRKVAAYGHSFGGATALETALRDPHVIGGLNLDGTVYGAVSEKGVKGKPFILVSNGGTRSFDFDEFYKKIDAPKMDLVIKDTRHNGLTDVPLLLLSAAPIPAEIQAGVEKEFGKLDGRRIEMAVNEITSGLLELVFSNKTKPLESVGKNRDIEVLNSHLPKGKL